MDTFDFSLIIACYNEEEALEKSIAKIKGVFDMLDLHYFLRKRGNC